MMEPQLGWVGVTFLHRNLYGQTFKNFLPKNHFARKVKTNVEASSGNV